MADLSTDCAGIRSPNPFWLASAPPANSGEQVMRAFEAGWGGAVWKTLGEPITNVSSRFGAVEFGGKKMMGFNNIELITDRPLDVNFAEITAVKKRFPNHAVIVSLMVESKEEWRDLIKRSEDTGCDGLELNFGCPHGMCERGMGSAVGQEPKVLQEITSWVKDIASVPVLVKLTPNISDINEPGRAAVAAGADGLSLINTIKSIVGVDLDQMIIEPKVGAQSSNGGYCGPAVKPIALHMVASLARDENIRLPMSGIGGISHWRDAAEFLALGCASVQVCTAVMQHGYRIIEELTAGLSNYLDEKGMQSVAELTGRAIPSYAEWGDLDLNHKVVAKIDHDKCIGCQLCYQACLDGAHQCIHIPEAACQAYHGTPDHGQGLRAEVSAPVFHQRTSLDRVPFIDESECIGCNLCAHVCPVDDCITMETQSHDKGPQSWNQRKNQACPQPSH